MKSAFGVEHGIAKSYLGAGKWGKATVVGAKKLRAAPPHASAKGITPKDARSKEDLTQSLQGAREAAEELGRYQTKNNKRLYINYAGKFGGSTTPFPIKGKSQRFSGAWVNVPAKPKKFTADHWRSSLQQRRDFSENLKARDIGRKRSRSATARFVLGDNKAVRDTYRHEMVHASTHRKPLSWIARVARDPKKLWGEEARADAAMSRSSRKGSLYRMIARGEPGASQDYLGAIYASKHGPRRYTQVERKLQNKKTRTYAVDSTGVATRGKSKP